MNVDIPNILKSSEQISVGNKIKFYRKLQKMTQKTLGEKVGCGEAAIRKYELGIRNPKLAQIRKIAYALNIHEVLLLDISGLEEIERLIKIGLLAEKYFDCCGISTEEFERLLKEQKK